MKTCPICQKEHDGSYGSGKFCSKHCQYVYIGRQTKKHVCNFPRTRTQKPWGTWKCIHCEQIFKTKKLMLEHIKAEHSRKDGRIWNYGLTKETNESVRKRCETIKKKFENGELNSSFKGKHHSEETKEKLSQIRKDYLTEHPDQVPYLLNHSSKISYPEQYFINAFKNESIDLIYHFRVGRYQLDFSNESKKLYIEIDGEQHFTNDKIFNSDINRNNFLSSLGWKGLRIRWSKYQSLSKEDQKFIIFEIKQFIENNKIPSSEIFSIV